MKTLRKLTLLTSLFVLMVNVNVIGQSVDWERSEGTIFGGSKSLNVWPDGVLFLGSYFNSSAKYKSIDEGESWVYIDSLSEGGEFLGNKIFSLSDNSWLTHHSFELLKKKDSTSGWQSIKLTDIRYVSDLLVLNDSTWILSSFLDGVFVTEDSGNTWINSYYKEDGISYDIGGVSSNGHIYINDDYSVLVSPDSGKNWNKVEFFEGKKLRGMDVQSDSSGTTYISNDSFDNIRVGYYKEEGSEEWNPLIHDSYQLDRVFVTKEGYLLAQGEINFEFKLFRSVDSGATWEEVIGDSDIISEIAYNTSKTKLFVSSWNGFFISTDSGETWQKKENGLSTFVGGGIYRKENGKYLIGSSRESLIFYSTDTLGLKWQKSVIDRNDIALPEWDLIGINDFITDDNGIIHAVSHGYLFTSENGGENWKITKRVGSAVGERNRFVKTKGGKIFVNSYDRVLSAELGEGFVETENGLDPATINGLIGDKEGSVYAYGKGIYYYDSDGDNWNSLTTSDQLPGDFESMYIDSENIFYGIIENPDFSFFVSTDSGKTWIDTEMRVGTYSQYFIPRAFQEDTLNHSIYLLANGYSILKYDKTTGIGTRISADGKQIRSFLIDEKGFIVANTNGHGVQRSNASLFAPVSPDITEAKVFVNDVSSQIDMKWNSVEGAIEYEFEISNTDDFFTILYNQVHADTVFSKEIENSLGTGNFYIRIRSIENIAQKGTWSRITEVQSELLVSNNVDEQLSKVIELHQNYPNPFNPSTNITFSLPNSSNVSLKIYNIVGQEVATLFEGYKNAGKTTLNWNASSYSSGVYFYLLKTDQGVVSKKMTLIK